MTAIDVPLQQIDPNLPLPAYAKAGDAGADLIAAEDVIIAPLGRALIPTGVAVALPEGAVGLIWPRSGLAVRSGIDVLGGVIDSGYRGEIKVALLNTDSTRSFHVHRGDRIAQFVIQRVERANFIPVDQLDASERGAGGFGSTAGFTTSPIPAL